MNQPQTFLFNTGVRPGNFSDYPELSDNQVIDSNGIMHIKFQCEDVPDGARFAHGAHTDTLNPHDIFIIRPIVGGGLLSKFAYFLKPLNNR